MKRILSLFTLLALLLTACEGDPGPIGPQGPPGFDGINADEYAAQSYEINIDFQYFSDTGLQEALINLPYDLLDSDVVLVYRLEAIVEIDGIPTEAWSALPQNFFLEDSNIIQYIFNHTFADVELLIDGNFDLSTLSSEFTQNQRFRIVILPADAITGLNLSNLDNVMETFNIDSFTSL